MILPDIIKMLEKLPQNQEVDWIKYSDEAAEVKFTYETGYIISARS